MQCFHRKACWLTDNGLSFRPVLGAKQVSVPCGKCSACRANRASAWAVRAQHEMEYCSASCFVTLTYDPEHCPPDYSLRPKDVQDFLKRLRITLARKRLGTIRSYFLCGEYGEKKGRPHYHVLIFGWCPPDLQYHSKSYSGESLYTSRLLEKVWGNGFCPVGTVGDGAAAYVARYAKKCDGFSSGSRVRPFFRSSRNIELSNGKQGAIGSQWFLDHYKELRHGYIAIRNRKGERVKCRIPDYYWDLLANYDPELYAHIKQMRFDYAAESSCGLFVVDGADHLPTVCFDASCMGVENQCRAMCDYFGFSLPSPLQFEASFGILVAQSRLRLSLLLAEQERVLCRLRRNYEQ